MAFSMGKYFHNLLLDNRRSLTITARQLNLTVEELKAYLQMDEVPHEFAEKFVTILKLYKIIDEPDVITPSCLDIIEQYKNEIAEYKKRLKRCQELEINFLEIIKMRLPDIYYGTAQEKYHEKLKQDAFFLSGA
jgi:hypothetical protein